MHKKYFLVIYVVLFYTINISGQVIKDKNSFIRTVLAVFNSRENGFDSISTSKNLGADKGFEPKILLPGADECYIKQGTYYAGYSFKDSIQAISFFKEIQGLLTEASTTYSAIVRFVPEPGNPYYLKFHIGNAEAFYWDADLINMFQHVLYIDYKVKGGIPLAGTNKLPANPYSLYLIFDGSKPLTAYFTSQGNRIINNEIINFVREIGFGKDTQMTLLKKNKKITDEGNTYESKRTLKGYKATIFETEDEDAIQNNLELLMQWTGKKDEEVFYKTDSLILTLKNAMPASYCYVVEKEAQRILFQPHPFTNEKPDASFIISYGVVDPKRKNFYYLALTIERLIEKEEEETDVVVREPKLIPFKSSGGKYGYKNESGEIVVAAKYDEAATFNETRGRVVVNKKHGFIDITGKEIIPLKYDYASLFFFYGLAEVKLNDKYGMIDINGKEVIPLKYDEIDKDDSYNTNKENPGQAAEFIMVKLQGKYGFVDKTNREIVPLKYDYAKIIGPGKARVGLNKKDGIIDIKGKEIVPVIYEAMNTDGYKEHGSIKVKLNEKWGLLDNTGKLVIPAKYNFTGYGFFEGLAWVNLNDKYGFVDKTGKEVIPLKYTYADNFSDGLANVKLNGKYGFIDKTGKEVIALRYENSKSFTRGLAAVQLNDKWGYIDKTGKLIIPCKYDDARDFDSNGEGKVYIGKKWGKINTKGIVVKPIANEDSDDDDDDW